MRVREAELLSMVLLTERESGYTFVCCNNNSPFGAHFFVSPSHSIAQTHTYTQNIPLKFNTKQQHFHLCDSIKKISRHRNCLSFEFSIVKRFKCPNSIENDERKQTKRRKNKAHCDKFRLQRCIQWSLLIRTYKNGITCAQLFRRWALLHAIGMCEFKRLLSFAYSFVRILWL